MPAIWQDLAKQQLLAKEQVQLTQILAPLKELDQNIREQQEFLTLLLQEPDDELLSELNVKVERLVQQYQALEFQKIFIHALDRNDAYLDIQGGSGGTEAQDWAEMLLRMYLKFGHLHNFEVQILEVSAGETAGIKSATLKLKGDFAYGWLKTETGVHRLVRKSPFDTNHKRHTSFASVFVYPDVDESIEIEINPSDLRIDTYRAQGAGGQHVNKTDSAVRIKHLTTGLIIQCQSERSQLQNRNQAMKQLKAKLYELELRKKQVEKEQIEATKLDISWGSQIRSYILDDSRVKDLRTGLESRNPTSILDGNLDEMIKESLKYSNQGSV